MTAYDMRTSAWSSDVCYSDLATTGPCATGSTESPSHAVIAAAALADTRPIGKLYSAFQQRQLQRINQLPMSESHPPTQKLLTWRIITAIPPGRNLMVMLAIVFAGAAEGLGIATVLPLVAVLGDEASKENALSRTILTVLDALHMPHDQLLLLGIIAGGFLTTEALTLLALCTIGRIGRAHV